MWNKIREKKKKFVVIAIFQVILILGGLIYYVLGVNHLRVEAIPLSSMELCNGKNENGALTIDESYGVVHFLHGPYYTLDRGTYEITFDYSMTGEENCQGLIYSDSATYDELAASDFFLTPGRNQETESFYLTKPIADFECRFIFLGTGTLSVTGITLQETALFYQIILFSSIAVAVLLGAIGLFLEIPHRIQNKHLLLLGIAALVSVPTFCDYLMGGHDIIYHLNRIEGIMVGLQSGQFPVRVQPNWMDGSGMATSIFYGDILLYIPALLRMVGLPVYLSYNIFIILCNIATVYVAHYSFSKITNNKYAAFAGAFLYAVAPYRYMDIYVRSAVGEYCAMIFLPLILSSMWEISQRKKGEKGRPWIPLAIGMSGVINTHVMTVEMIVLLLIVIVLWKIRTFLAEKRWVQFVKAMGATLVWNLWFLVPFLQFFLSNNYEASREATIADMEKAGTFLGQLLMVFPSYAGQNAYAADGIKTDMPLCIGISIFLGSLFCIWMYRTHRAQNEGAPTEWDKSLKFGRLIAIAGILMCLMTLTEVPWNWIGAKSSIIRNLTTNIQFIWRILSPVTVLLTGSTVVVIAYVMEQRNQKERKIYQGILITLMGVALLGIFAANDSLLGSNDPVRIYTADGLDSSTNVTSQHYLPLNTDIALVNQYTPVTASENVDIISSTIEGSNASVVLANNGGEGTLTIPFIYYPGYTASSVDDGKILSVAMNGNKHLEVLIPDGTSGEVKVEYKELWYWKVADIISMLSIIMTPVYVIWSKKKNRMK